MNKDDTKNQYPTLSVQDKVSDFLLYTAPNSKVKVEVLFKHAPNGRILKSDTTIGKKYLQEDEIKKLERAVSAFFDYIEGIIERRNSFTMQGFAESVNKFLAFNEYKVLDGYGSISRKQAEQKAWAEYEQFNKIQNIESDFDKQTKALLKAQKNLGSKT